MRYEQQLPTRSEAQPEQMTTQKGRREQQKTMNCICLNITISVYWEGKNDDCYKMKAIRWDRFLVLLVQSSQGA